MKGRPMPAPRQLPDNETLVSLRNQDWSYQDIADQYGVTKGAVHWQLQKAGATKRRPSHKSLIPWVVRTEHTHAHPPMMLRLLGRRRAGDDTIPPSKARMLDKWLEEIAAADVVVGYHPDMPPTAASARGGWYYAKRTPADGDSIIRYIDPATTAPPRVANEDAKVDPARV